MAQNGRLPRAVGINHVALEVDDVEAAVAFYSRLFDLRGVERAYGGAFLDLGDQFIALFPPGAGEDQHFGLVVDDKERARRVLAEQGAEVLPGRFLDFRDPFGNRVQVVQYDQIQFLKTPQVLAGMGLPALGKSEAALAELRSNGLAGS
jgi:predicted enzyme related to lactoylglutathione lyase